MNGFSYSYEEKKCISTSNCVILCSFLAEGNFLHLDLLCVAKKHKSPKLFAVIAGSRLGPSSCQRKLGGYHEVRSDCILELQRNHCLIFISSSWALTLLQGDQHDISPVLRYRGFGCRCVFSTKRRNAGQMMRLARGFICYAVYYF